MDLNRVDLMAALPFSDPDPSLERGGREFTGYESVYWNIAFLGPPREEQLSF